MSDATEPIFFDRDPGTGKVSPTTYESMRAATLKYHPIPQHVPEDIRGLLLAAVEYVALAYEQANVGRRHLYERLTNDAFLKMALALELTLRRQLARGNRVTLEKLICQGIDRGLLPATGDYEALWTELRKNRNAIAHGDPERSSYGPSTARWIGFVIDAISAMYASQDTAQDVDRSST